MGLAWREQNKEGALGSRTTLVHFLDVWPPWGKPFLIPHEATLVMSCLTGMWPGWPCTEACKDGTKANLSFLKSAHHRHSNRVTSVNSPCHCFPNTCNYNNRQNLFHALKPYCGYGLGFDLAANTSRGIHSPHAAFYVGLTSPKWLKYSPNALSTTSPHVIPSLFFPCVQWIENPDTVCCVHLEYGCYF